MRKTLILTALVLVLGVGLVAAAYCVACRLLEDADAPGMDMASRGTLGPVEVVQEYSFRSGSCGALKLDDLTAPIPDEHMSLLFHEKENYLEKKYKTADGLISLADNARPIYLNFITVEFPQHLCNHKYTLGRILDVETGTRRARVKVNFVSTEGAFGSPWTFNLIKRESGWQAFYLEGPGPYKRRVRLPKVSEIKSPTEQKDNRTVNGSKPTIRARP